MQEDLIDFKVVPDLKREFVNESDDLVLFWASKVAVLLLELREAAHEFLVLFGSTRGHANLDSRL